MSNFKSLQAFPSYVRRHMAAQIAEIAKIPPTAGIESRSSAPAFLLGDNVDDDEGADAAVLVAVDEIAVDVGLVPGQ